MSTIVIKEGRKNVIIDDHTEKRMRALLVLDEGPLPAFLQETCAKFFLTAQNGGMSNFTKRELVFILEIARLEQRLDQLEAYVHEDEESITVGPETVGGVVENLMGDASLVEDPEPKRGPGRPRKNISE